MPLLSYLGVKLVTLATGEVTALHIGMLGTLAQLTLADLREKTRRGQLGRALQGKIPGGRAYGYDVIDPRSKDGRGERAINAAEADVVRRIFAAFANGESPRAIAKRLNAEGVPGPDGRAWRDTTIRSKARFLSGTFRELRAIYPVFVMNWPAFCSSKKRAISLDAGDVRHSWKRSVVPP